MNDAFEVAVGIASGLAETVHQFAFYAFLTIEACLLLSLPLMAIGIAYATFKAMTEKAKRPPVR